MALEPRPSAQNYSDGLIPCVRFRYVPALKYNYQYLFLVCVNLIHLSAGWEIFQFAETQTVQAILVGKGNS